MRTEYSETEIGDIRRLVAADLTYAEIAERFPHRTHKSVSMQIQRMGLTAKLSNRPENRSERDYLRRLLRETANESPNKNVEHDEAFQRAVKNAVADGLEFVSEGVSTVPCTENPKMIRPSMPVCLRSSALVCLEHGDTRAGAHF